MVPTWVDSKEEIFVLVHPHVHRAQCVVVENAHDAARPRVRRYFAEDVAYTRARGYEDCAATLPHLHAVQATQHGLNQGLKRRAHKTFKYACKGEFML